ncbi:MAG: hypothetical protein RMM53_04265 [Bacteroidia bacterium]|nr:hypothetical protein [Bacteroidia bacterium]MDW8333412.1 hypothetical protein [Bacteroidia bacterium]
MSREKFFRGLADALFLAAVVIWFVIIPYEVISAWRARLDFDRTIQSIFGWAVYALVLIFGRWFVDSYRESK